MYYEFPLKEKAYHACLQAEQTRDAVVFRPSDNKEPDTMFLLAHGSKDGRVELKGHLYSLEDALKALLLKGIKDYGITTVYTICCHGGIQESATVDGVTIQSMHTSTDVIYTKARCTMDDEYILCVETKGE